MQHSPRLGFKRADRRAIETSKERTRRDAISLHERRFAWRRSHDRARFRMDRARRPRLPGEEHLIGHDGLTTCADWSTKCRRAESEFMVRITNLAPMLPITVEAKRDSAASVISRIFDSLHP